MVDFSEGYVVPTCPIEGSICNEMMDTSKAILDARRADFQGCPPEFRSKLLALICEAEPERADWWWDVLVGEGDPLYRGFEVI